MTNNIIDKTVIIIGAGASVNYGFPSGKNLLEEIAYGSFHLKTPEEKTKITNHLFSFDSKESLFNTLNAKEHEISRILDLKHSNYVRTNHFDFFVNLQSSLKLFRKSQIDYFLRSYEKYREVGKSLIARFILQKEDEAKKIVEGIHKSNGDDCFGTLLANLIEKASKLEDLKEITKKLTIITFNYDLLLEYYLDIFCRGDGLWNEPLMEFKKELPIIHIYGKLGKFNWEKNLDIYDENIFSSFTERKEDKFGFYRNEFDYNVINKISKGIQVVGGDKHYYNNQKYPKHIQIAQKKIREAQKIFFLGFGFDRNNLNLLGFTGKYFENRKSKGKEIYYTNYYEKGKEKDEYIESVIKEKIGTEEINSHSCSTKIIRSGRNISPLLKCYL